MAKRSKKNSSDDGFVYSTNPNATFGDLFAGLKEGMDDTSNSDITLEVHISKKGRAGKVATLVVGHPGSEEELKELAKELRSHCGVGGSVKDGEILLQGEVRNKVMDYLNEKGFTTKRVGG
ncbi:MAG: translation initiation factor [Flavobacteriia bacterium]|nr:translation initiation factor [Flavobacteriia bacterium]